MELRQLLNACKEVEMAVASVYRTFMDIFPQDKLFWQDLYRDELEHSYWLSDALHVEAVDLLPSKDILPTLGLIESTVQFVKGQMKYIRSNPVSPEEAFKIALKLEESMIETFTNELTANILSSDYDSLTERIITAEKIHINKIEDMMIGKGFLQLS